MKSQNQKSDPKEKGGNNPSKDNTSRPKDPNNDPDQTPNREVKNPPQADPGKQGGPGQNQTR